MTSVTDRCKSKDESTSEIPRVFACFLEKPSRNYCLQKTKISRPINDSFAGGSQRIVTKVNLIEKLLTDLAF